MADLSHPTTAGPAGHAASAYRASPPSRKGWRRLNVLLSLALVAVLGVIVAATASATIPAAIGYKENLGRNEQPERFEDFIDPSWIKSGSPVFHTTIFERTPYSATSSGIWECEGPAKFVWHYTVDETIYVLEGSAEIEYMGNRFTLSEGESTTFVAGTSAHWEVKDRVKKTFRIQKPGFVVKVMRKFFDYFDA